MVGGTVLGTGVNLDVEQREAFGAVGTTIASIINIFRQIADYAYRVSLWLIEQISSNPFGMVALGLNVTILLS